MQRRRYKAPPIQEVICEVALDEHTLWDPAVPGMLYEKLKDHFPAREQRGVQEAEVVLGTGGLSLTVKRNERAVFLRQDRRCLVQVGERLLAINHLAPYPGWDVFKKSIDIAYEALRDTVTLKGIRSLSLRYVDRIEIPSPAGRVRIEEYFLFRPHFEGVREADPLDTWQGFIVGIQVPFNEDRDVLRIQMGLGPPGNDKTTFILETIYGLARSGTVEPEKVHQWLETAHQRVLDAFEGAITDKLRALFQPE